MLHRGLLAVLVVVATAPAPGAMAEPHAFTVFDARSVPAPLGGLRGDPLRGAVAAAEHCAGCHEAGFDFAGANAGRMRLAIIDRAILDPDAGPHAFYIPDAEGRTGLTAQTVEDIVVFLAGDPERRVP